MTSSSHLAFISKRTTGILLIIGIVLIFALHIALLLPFTITIGLTMTLALTATFLRNPLIGFLATVVIRTSVDFLDGYFAIRIAENVTLNIASALAMLLIAMAVALIIPNFKKFTHTPLIWSFFAFILFSGLSVIYSIDKSETLQETVRLISIFATFAVGHFFCITIPEARKIIITTVLFASILPISFALFQLATGTGFSDNTGTDGRLFGTFKHPNSFASFLIIIIAILTYRVFSTSTFRSDHSTKITLLTLTIVLLILTFSRGGWLALVIFFGIFTLIRAPKALLFSIVIGIALFFTSSTIHDRIEDIYNPPADSSIRWRFQQWQNAINAWQLSPIYGYGAGTEIAIHEKEQGFTAGNPYTHNDLIKVLQETGVIGLILFTLLICTTLVRLIITYHSLPSGNDQLFVLTIFLLLIAEIGFGMSSNIWRGTAVQWLLWLLIACALSFHSQEKISSTSPLLKK